MYIYKCICWVCLYMFLILVNTLVVGASVCGYLCVCVCVICIWVQLLNTPVIFCGTKCFDNQERSRGLRRWSQTGFQCREEGATHPPGMLEDKWGCLSEKYFELLPLQEKGPMLIPSTVKPPFSMSMRKQKKSTDCLKVIDSWFWNWIIIYFWMLAGDQASAWAKWSFC